DTVTRATRWTPGVHLDVTCRKPPGHAAARRAGPEAIGAGRRPVFGRCPSGGTGSQPSGERGHVVVGAAAGMGDFADTPQFVVCDGDGFVEPAAGEPRTWSERCADLRRYDRPRVEG